MGITWMTTNTPRREKLVPQSLDLTHSPALMVLNTWGLTSLTIRATALLVMPRLNLHQDPLPHAPPQHLPQLPPGPQLLPKPPLPFYCCCYPSYPRELCPRCPSSGSLRWLLPLWIRWKLRR